jgi:hypothetical protein
MTTLQACDTCAVVTSNLERISGRCASLRIGRLGKGLSEPRGVQIRALDRTPNLRLRGTAL